MTLKTYISIKLSIVLTLFGSTRMTVLDSYHDEQLCNVGGQMTTVEAYSQIHYDSNHVPWREFQSLL